MFDRLPTAPTLALLLSIALAACEGSEGPTGPTGPTGPAGEAGPGTRRVFSGTINDPSAPDTVAVVQQQALPPEAGTLTDPPTLTCWLSADGVFWFQDLCPFVASEDQTSLIVLLLGLNGWLYSIVVVY